jgi:hypothetical protein
VRELEEEREIVREGEEGEKLEHGVGDVILLQEPRGRRGLVAAIDGNGADTQELPVGERR